MLVSTTRLLQFAAEILVDLLASELLAAEVDARSHRCQQALSCFAPLHGLACLGFLRQWIGQKYYQDASLLPIRRLFLQFDLAVFIDPC